MFRVLPTPVQFSEESVSIHRVRCGTDGTMFLTEDGTLYACGRYITRLPSCCSFCNLFKFFQNIFALFKKVRREILVISCFNIDVS